MPWTILALILTGGIVAGFGVGIGTGVLIMGGLVLVGLAVSASLQ